ncbi:cytochrome P450, family 3, subfamily A [Stemphylium lycopersici]|uniref:Cytochrome P450 n=1 Tax=Stemphylium lycopersici TaxID=183478 RepID=A0A364MVB8_STELY|nr:cytochrome P450, family 3, subfamily A [Stemphylium lycopersici]RAR04615.1 cytochrome P450 [Stemphylium lycopersici]
MNVTTSTFPWLALSTVDSLLSVDQFSTVSMPYPRNVVASLLAIVVSFSYVQSFAKKTGLESFPGPWYAPYTAMHLRWLFARGTIYSYVEEMHKKYGDVIRLGPRQIWVSDKGAMKQILLTVDLPKVSMYAEISRDRSSPGLFGEIRPVPHRNLKKFLSPAFTVASVDKLDSFFKACVSTLLDNYYNEVNKAIAEDPKTNPNGNVETDFMRDLHCLALDIMGQSSFGKGFGQIDKIFDPSKMLTGRDRRWSKIPDAIFDGQARRYGLVFIKRFLRRMGYEWEVDWPKEMTTAICELVDERAAAQGTVKSEERIDVLQHMLDEGARPDTGERMSNQDIIDQMSELLLAGSETTSGTMACLFVELARTPAARIKLLASLPPLSPSSPILDSKTVRTDPQFRYLEACLKENLRMNPIASELGRRTLHKGQNLNGFEVPPFTIVSASYRALHRDERYWPEPNRFWPERWLEGEEREGAPEPE